MKHSLLLITALLLAGIGIKAQNLQLSTMEKISQISKINTALDSLFVRDSIIGNFIIYRNKNAIDTSIRIKKQ